MGKPGTIGLTDPSVPDDAESMNAKWQALMQRRPDPRADGTTTPTTHKPVTPHWTETKSPWARSVRFTYLASGEPAFHEFQDGRPIARTIALEPSADGTFYRVGDWIQLQSLESRQVSDIYGVALDQEGNVLFEMLLGLLTGFEAPTQYPVLGYISDIRPTGYDQWRGEATINHFLVVGDNVVPLPEGKSHVEWGAWDLVEYMIWFPHLQQLTQMANVMTSVLLFGMSLVVDFLTGKLAARLAAANFVKRLAKPLMVKKFYLVRIAVEVLGKYGTKLSYGFASGFITEAVKQTKQYVLDTRKYQHLGAGGVAPNVNQAGLKSALPGKEVKALGADAFINKLDLKKMALAGIDGAILESSKIFTKGIGVSHKNLGGADAKDSFLGKLIGNKREWMAGQIAALSSGIVKSMEKSLDEAANQDAVYTQKLIDNQGKALGEQFLKILEETVKLAGKEMMDSVV
jgi:hypothetical protein